MQIADRQNLHHRAQPDIRVLLQVVRRHAKSTTPEIAMSAVYAQRYQ
jgi:hypothetical protein